MTTVITFDVDGTLVISEGQNANRLHKLAFAHAWRTVFGFEGDIDEVPHHVRTSPPLVTHAEHCMGAR
jgi:phosphoglycolate phosphatase